MIRLQEKPYQYIDMILNIGNIVAYFVTMKLYENNYSPIAVAVPGILFIVLNIFFYARNSENWTKAHKIAEIILVIVWIIIIASFILR